MESGMNVIQKLAEATILGLALIKEESLTIRGPRRTSRRTQRRSECFIPDADPTTPARVR